MSANIKFNLVEISRLKAHEFLDATRLNRLRDQIRRQGHLNRPIMIDGETKTIIDGHHRLGAVKLLGCRFIPAYSVDYRSPEVVVLSRRKDVRVTKELVKMAALSKDKFPPRTTRHMIIIRGKLHHISRLERPVAFDLEELAGFRCR